MYGPPGSSRREMNGSLLPEIFRMKITELQEAPDNSPLSFISTKNLLSRGVQCMPVICKGDETGITGTGGECIIRDLKLLTSLSTCLFPFPPLEKDRDMIFPVFIIRPLHPDFMSCFVCCSLWIL